MKAPRNSFAEPSFFKTEHRSVSASYLTNQGGSKMTKFLISAAAVITLLAMTDAAFAAGASKFAPGHNKMHGTHSASFNSPGHMFLRAGPKHGHPGASGYAPGVHVRH
jgi:hypothetical protein